MFHANLSHTGEGTGPPALTPNVLWKYTTNGTIEASPVIANGVVYIGSNDGNFYALNANNGKQIWNYTTGSFVESSAAVANGVVYVGSDDNNFYALNLANGKKIWNYSTLDTNFVVTCPSVLNGVVYFGSFINTIGGVDDFTGYVYAFNADNGIQLWNFSTGGGVTSSPAIVGGVVYVGAEDDNVYALNATMGQNFGITLQAAL